MTSAITGDDHHGMTSLLIVDDHALFREGIAMLLAREGDFEILGKCASARDALLMLDRVTPKVILLDFDLGPELAVEFARSAKEKGFAGSILVLTAGVTEYEALQLVQSGVTGILHKHHPPEVLSATIRQVASGEVYVEKTYLKAIFKTINKSQEVSDPELGDRDKMILRYVFQGLANKEIATRLQVSEGTVKACLRQLFQKLGAHTRAQLVKVALERYGDQL